MAAVDRFPTDIRNKITEIYRQVVKEAGPAGIDFETAVSIATTRIKRVLTVDEKSEIAFIGLLETLDEEANG